MKYDRYLERAIESGATHAAVVDTEKVVTANWVRLKCQYGCSTYGTRLTCPPYSPAPDYTGRMLKEYERGLLLLYRVEAKEEKKRRKAVRNAVADLEREMFLDGYYKAYGMGAGPCNLCRNCDLTAPCKHPDRARPSMEASGIDVYQTARYAGFEMEVVRSWHDTCALCALVLIE